MDVAWNARNNLFVNNMPCRRPDATRSERRLLLLLVLGPCPGPCPPYCGGDMDGDCEVGLSDFVALLAGWG
jgi:hypothetical protein